MFASNMNMIYDTKSVVFSKKEVAPEAEPEPEPVSFLSLFRFATKGDIAYMMIGTIAAIANGAAMPVYALILGNMFDALRPGSSKDDVVSKSGAVSLDFLYVGLGTWILSYISFGFWMISGERQANRYRSEYFRAILRQDIAYFDKINPSLLTTKVATETFNIQTAIGEKVSTFIYCISMCFSGLVIGYVKGTLMALVMTAALPYLLFLGWAFAYVLQQSEAKSKTAYEAAGGYAEQALNAVRTVLGLNGEAKEEKNYTSALEESTKISIKYAYLVALFMGLTFSGFPLIYALGYWFGSTLVEDHKYNPVTGADYSVGDILTVFNSITFGAFNLGQATPCLKAFAQGRVAAAKMFPVIDRVPAIDTESTAGIKNQALRGQIRLNDVRFSYPGKTELEILKGISLTIEPGKKIALVGESGCGKSTVMQLIERFYDVTSGELTIDGINIKDYNLKWLRQQIGYVGQEPVLFNTSIRENMLIANDKATDEEIYDALKKAKAYNFVMDQQEKLDTQVGTGGAKLSGGQKQRLAIARAILKNPSIFLLDEATSALDRTNEAIIQKTLEEVSVGKTTIVIAHRLSTIRNSDIIYVVDHGRVIESGNHDLLMSTRGKYYSLVQSQEEAATEMNRDDNTENQTEFQTELSLESPAQVIDPVPLAIHAETKLEKVEDQLKQHLKKSQTPQKEEIKIDINEEKSEEGANKAKEEEVPFSRLKEYSKPELLYIILGVIGAAANGAVIPTLSIPLSGILNTLSNPDSPTFREDANRYVLIYVWIGIGAFFANFLQRAMLSIVSDRLTWRLRTTLFNKMLRMDIGWFDEEKNQAGSLAALLASDVSQVKSMSGEIIGLIIQSVSSFITGMIIAFASSWSLTFIALGLSPLIVISGRLQTSMTQGFSAGTDDAYKQSGSLISEAVNNMRTVASFGNEQKLRKLYDGMLEKPTAQATKKGHLAGFFFGMSQFNTFGMMAVVFYVGAIFFRDYGLSIEDMYRSIYGIVYAAFGAGQGAQFMPDLGAAQNAMKRIFAIIDAESKIDPKKSGSYKGEVKGLIEFQNVHFKYPTRERKILNGLNLTIRPGEKIALVGPSGCGKSTIMQLLLRFYDPDQGRILVDGHDIKEYDLHYLRQQLGVVSQEPVLFNGSIEYNIKYTNENASDDFMRECARQANALDFIEKNQFQEIQDQNNKSAQETGTGFKRAVGPKGSQISGGQKQRIAIARAIMKQPKIYLFDEATSALDNVSEKIVQESLNSLMVGHTSITIAHRLSTIRDSDAIHVLHNGEIIESGRYEELISRKGTFFQMENGTLALSQLLGSRKQ